MSAYEQQLVKTPIFNPQLAGKKADTESEVNEDELYASKSEINTHRTSNIETNTLQVAGNVTNIGATHSFTNFHSIIWRMSGKPTGSNVTGDDVEVFYSVNPSNNILENVIGKITPNTITDKGYACAIEGTGLSNEDATQYSTSTGAWTCRNKGLYMVLSNLYYSKRTSAILPIIQLKCVKANGTSFKYYIRGAYRWKGNTDSHRQQYSNIQYLHLDVGDYLQQIVASYDPDNADYEQGLYIRFQGDTGTESRSEFVITRIVG
jgi:hypothetical protein